MVIVHYTSTVQRSLSNSSRLKKLSIRITIKLFFFPLWLHSHNFDVVILFFAYYYRCASRDRMRWLMKSKTIIFLFRFFSFFFNYTIYSFIILIRTYEASFLFVPKEKIEKCSENEHLFPFIFFCLFRKIYELQKHAERKCKNVRNKTK